MTAIRIAKGTHDVGRRGNVVTGKILSWLARVRPARPVVWLQRLALLVLTGWFVFPIAAMADCQLLLLVDNSRSVSQYDVLASKLRSLTWRLVNNEPPVSVVVVPIGGREVGVRFFDSSEAIRDNFYHTLTFSSLYTWITPAVEAVLEHPGIALGPETTVVVLSDFRPDHDFASGYDREEFTDLKTSLDLLASGRWRGAQVHSVFLGKSPSPPRELAPELSLGGLTELRGVLTRYAVDHTRCWKEYGSNCSSVQEYLRLMTAKAVAEYHGTIFRHLTRAMEVNDLISDVLFKNRCMPEQVSDTISVGWLADGLPGPVRDLLRKRLIADRIVSHDYPRTIRYKKLDLDDYLGFSRVRFVLHLEPGLGAYDVKATLHSVKPGQSTVVAGPQSLPATSARSSVSGVQDFLNSSLREAIERELPSPRGLLNVRIVYGVDEKPAPGYYLRFGISRTGFQAFSGQSSDRSGFVEILMTESASGELVAFEQDPEKGGVKPVASMNFDSAGYLPDEIATFSLPTFRLALMPGQRPGGGSGYYYRICKLRTRDCYAMGQVGSTEASVTLPGGSFVVNGLPLDWTKYLQWSHEIDLRADIALTPGVFDIRRQEYREFVVDRFAQSFRRDVISVEDDEISSLFQGFPRDAGRYRTLSDQESLQWRFSPFVFHVLNRLLASGWRDGSKVGRLKSALALYQVFGFDHPLWLMRRGATDSSLSNPFEDRGIEVERDRRLRDYLLALWRAVIFATPHELQVLKDYLVKVESEGGLGAVWEDASFFLKESLGWQRFEPIENGDNASVRALLEETGMIP